MLMFFFLMHTPITRYQGYIGAALVLGGVDVTGPHLYSIYPHGSTDKLPYVTMGEYNIFLMFQTSLSYQVGLWKGWSLSC
jgi:hypothetical protein